MCISLGELGEADLSINLLVLASTYPRWAGDPEPSFVHELARRMGMGFRVIVVCPHAPGAKQRELLDGVEVVRYRYAPERLETLVNDGGIVANLKARWWKLLLVPGFVFAQAWCAWKICRRSRIDVIHAHWIVPQGLIAWFLRVMSRRDLPFLVTSHGADLYALRGRVFEELKRAVLRRSGNVTVVSEAMRTAVAGLGVEPSKVEVRPMGVDMSQRFTLPAADSRSHYELLFVGRLVEKKGLRYLLDALPAVLRQRPQTQLTVAGFGPEEAQLRATARRLGVDQAIRFLGPVPQSELPALYQRAALFVAPFVTAATGDEEGLGLVVVEAIACGCPVLTGNVAAARQVFGSRFEAMTVDPTDAASLAGRIIDLLNDPSRAQADVIALRDEICLRMDWSAVASGYRDLLTSMAGRPRGNRAAT